MLDHQEQMLYSSVHAFMHPVIGRMSSAVVVLSDILYRLSRQTVGACAKSIAIKLPSMANLTTLAVNSTHMPCRSLSVR